MASMTMAAASLVPSLSKNAIPSGRRSSSGLVVVAKASSGGVGVAAEGDQQQPNLEMKSNGRRELMFVGAAMAACSIAKAALADEPKPGTPEAKKKYAPVCVTMPTARICKK